MFASSSSLSMALETPFSTSFRTSGVGETSRCVDWAVRGAVLEKALARRASAARPDRRESAIPGNTIAKGGPRGVAGGAPVRPFDGLSVDGRPWEAPASPRPADQPSNRSTVSLASKPRQQLVVVRRVRDPLDQPLHPGLRGHLAEATPERVDAVQLVRAE